MATQMMGSDIELPVPEEAPVPAVEAAPPLSPEELRKAIYDVVKEYEDEDRTTHEAISAECRKYELYWQNIQDIIWDSSSRDWVSASGVLQSSRDLDVDPSILDKTIGIYRSYGEIVAAALSQTVPIVRFPPSDADNGADITTSRTSNAIAELIQKNNDAQLLFLKALYTKFNQHFVAAYHAVIEDSSYGTVRRPVIGLKETSVPSGEVMCPECGGMREGDLPCEICGSMAPPVPEMMVDQVPYVKEILEAPKGRVKIEVFGPRQVKVQPHCKDIGSTPYLILETDLHENLIKELFPEYDLSGVRDDSEIRASDRRPTIEATENKKIHTLKRIWLRPWAFNGIQDEEKRAYVRSQFPDGLHAVIVDKQVLAQTPEIMDAHWTFLADPFAEYVHGDPKGKMIAPIQDMFNDGETLTLETILHNIPEMWADPNVVNFKTYGDREARPGQLNQAVAPQGQNLSAGFFQPQGATLSKEVDAFLVRLQELAQFVVGAPPSIWGGTQEGGSGTLGEYQQSRAQAQQRLGTDWKMLNYWWRDVIQKSVEEYRAFMKNLSAKVQDPMYAENFVKKDGETYTNVWIRLEEMSGSTGEAEAETSDRFPVSWEQQRGLLFEILQSPNPALASIVTNPENITAMRDILGIYKLKIPGEQDRDKQLYEISQMLAGMPVMIDQFVDNHIVHWQTTSGWANSPTGRDAKLQNPMGYQLVMQHAMMHYMAALSMQQPGQQQEGASGKPGESPAEKQGSAEKPSTGGSKGEKPE